MQIPHRDAKAIVLIAPATRYHSRAILEHNIVDWKQRARYIMPSRAYTRREIRAGGSMYLQLNMRADQRAPFNPLLSSFRSFDDLPIDTCHSRSVDLLSSLRASNGTVFRCCGAALLLTIPINSHKFMPARPIVLTVSRESQSNDFK